MLLTSSASLCAAARDLWEWDGVSAGVEAEADACFELRARRLPLRLSLPFPLALLLLVLLDALQHALGTLLLALLAVARTPSLRRLGAAHAIAATAEGLPPTPSKTP